MLSHWPVNNTPDPLRRDTSTATVFAYLDNPGFHADARLVSNNHFDEDGLFSMFALCAPDIALTYRELLEGAATAGDFGTYTNLDAARLCFVIEAFADPAQSPLPPETFSGCEAVQVSSLYRRMLEQLPEILDDVDALEEYWTQMDKHLAESELLIKGGRVDIEEFPELDLAVVTIPEDLPVRTVRRYLCSEEAVVHPFAIHNATECHRIVRVQGGRLEFQYRYESWVRLVSKRPLLRVDLAGMARRLNEIETAHGTWRQEGFAEVVPRVYLEGTDTSSLSAARFVDEVSRYLVSAPVAWNPYDWAPGDRDQGAAKKHG